MVSNPTRRKGTSAKKGSDRSKNVKLRNPVSESMLNGWQNWPIFTAPNNGTFSCSTKQSKKLGLPAVAKSISS